MTVAIVNNKLQINLYKLKMPASRAFFIGGNLSSAAGTDLHISRSSEVGETKT